LGAWLSQAVGKPLEPTGCFIACLQTSAIRKTTDVLLGSSCQHVDHTNGRQKNSSANIKKITPQNENKWVQSNF
jgi:hypothetical protein